MFQHNCYIAVAIWLASVDLQIAGNDRGLSVAQTLMAIYIYIYLVLISHFCEISPICTHILLSRSNEAVHPQTFATLMLML